MPWNPEFHYFVKEIVFNLCYRAYVAGEFEDSLSEEGKQIQEIFECVQANKATQKVKKLAEINTPLFPKCKGKQYPSKSAGKKNKQTLSEEE